MNDSYDPTRPADNSGEPPASKTSGLAITGLILGLVGVCFVPLGIVALVLGIMALNQISDSGRALTGRGMAITATVLGGLSIAIAPLALMVGIMLPALGAARRAAQQMKNTTQLRLVTQSMITDSTNNRGHYVGLDKFGDPVDLTVEGRFTHLLDQNYFTPDALISPSETKTPWVAGLATSDNYSFSLSDISDAGGRRDEWRDTMNYRAITISDRNTGHSSAPSGVQSIHTDAPGHWAGSIGRNDGSASFENTHELDVQYGKGQPHLFDNIFEMTADDDAMMIYTGE